MAEQRISKAIEEDRQRQEKSIYDWTWYDWAILAIISGVGWGAVLAVGRLLWIELN